MNLVSALQEQATGFQCPVEERWAVRFSRLFAVIDFQVLEYDVFLLGDRVGLLENGVESGVRVNGTDVI